MSGRARCIRAVLGCAILLFSTMTAGEAAPPAPPGAATWYTGGSATLWHAWHGEEDEPGAGYLYTQFHGAPGGARPGLTLSAGRMVWRGLSVQVEIGLRRAYVGQMSEDLRTKFEFMHLDSTYDHREVLVSAFARWHPSRRTRRVDIEPLAGFTLARATESLTNRSGTYDFPYGSMPVTRPDETWTWTAFGPGGGADVVILLDRDGRVALVGSTRFHWIRRRPRSEVVYDEIPPGTGAAQLQIGVGLQWTGGRKGR